jgi:hypothetical protein
MVLGGLWALALYIGLQVVAQEGPAVATLATGLPNLVQDFGSWSPELQRIAGPISIVLFVLLVGVLVATMRRPPALPDFSLPVVLSAAMSLLVFRLRLIAVAFLIVAFIFHLRLSLQKGSPRTTLAFWAIFLALSFSPVDVSLIRYSGPPRLAKVVSGLPSQSLMSDAAAGEIFLAGCEGGELAPWLWVW